MSPIHNSQCNTRCTRVSLFYMPRERVSHSMCSPEEQNHKSLKLLFCKERFRSWRICSHLLRRADKTGADVSLARCSTRTVSRVPAPLSQLLYPSEMPTSFCRQLANHVTNSGRLVSNCNGRGKEKVGGQGLGTDSSGQGQDPSPQTRSSVESPSDNQHQIAPD